MHIEFRGLTPRASVDSKIFSEKSSPYRLKKEYYIETQVSTPKGNISTFEGGLTNPILNMLSRIVGYKHRQFCLTRRSIPLKQN